jgi:hypothetical protein
MITVKIPGPEGAPVEKTVEVGGAVSIPVEGTVYSVIGKVLEIDESGQDAYPVRIKGVGFEGWIRLNQITDVMDPSTYALHHALNVIGAT